ncbi:helix-turn-helix domain-containing protein [Arenibaculum pallidiluteum]|uniref:helix-turn-helix domain-containing protein n=1 Tax=Arenibaculum pallidiluteum TaxID=2812559 RepID=UPI001A964539|nr:helix-turn-helix domain-containing protein [Arenibaculum pallidiluteum]
MAPSAAMHAAPTLARPPMPFPAAMARVLPFPSSRPEADPLDAIATTSVVDRDIAIFHQGGSADALFRLVDGVVRIHKLLPDGRRQIVGFLQAGDFFGLAFGDTYLYTAEAVTVATVRRMSRSRVDAVMDEHPALRQRLLVVTAEELIAAQDQMLLLGRKNAVEKICSFLTMLSRRRARQGKDPARLHVPMSRADIADYLGLTIETVSRTITKLKTAGTIRLLDGNKIALCDPETVASLAEGA